MTSESSVHLIVDSKDIQCGICYQRYSYKTNKPMILSCGHSICSICLPKLGSCPHCREAIQRTPVKNLLANSLLEKDSQTKKCSIHEKSQDYFSKKIKRFVCSDCIMEEHQEEYASVQNIELKVKQIEEQQEKIRKKKNETKTTIKELLGKRERNLMNVADTMFEEEYANLRSLQKKRKGMVESISLPEKNCYEDVLAAEDLSKHEQKTKKMLKKWNQNPDNGELAAEILEAPSQIQNLMEQYENEKKKIIQKIDEEEKALEGTILESKCDIDLTIETSQKSVDKIQDPNQELPKFIFRKYEDPEDECRISCPPPLEMFFNKYDFQRKVEEIFIKIFEKV